jgi:hypothetical protein
VPVLQPIVKAGNGLTLSWSAVASRSYQLQFTTNLAQATWKNLGAPLTATNGMVQTSDAPGPDARRFYRVALLP